MLPTTGENDDLIANFLLLHSNRFANSIERQVEMLACPITVRLSFAQNVDRSRSHIVGSYRRRRVSKSLVHDPSLGTRLQAHVAKIHQFSFKVVATYDINLNFFKIISDCIALFKHLYSTTSKKRYVQQFKIQDTLLDYPNLKKFCKNSVDFVYLPAKIANGRYVLLVLYNLRDIRLLLCTSPSKETSYKRESNSYAGLISVQPKFPASSVISLKEGLKRSAIFAHIGRCKEHKRCAAERQSENECCKTPALVPCQVIAPTSEARAA